MHMPCRRGASSRKGSECSRIRPSSKESEIRVAAMRATTSATMIAGMIATSPPTSVRMATSVMVMRDMPVSTAPAPSSAKAPGVRPGWMSASRNSSPG